MLDVPDHATDYDPLHRRIARPADAFAEQALIRKILLNHLVVGDANRRRLVIKVPCLEISAALQRNLHYVKVIAHDTARFRLGSSPAAIGGRPSIRKS